MRKDKIEDKYLTEFESDKYQVSARLAEMFSNLIQSSKKLSEENKMILLSELSGEDFQSHYQLRHNFKGDEFVKELAFYAYERWKQEQFNFMELWQKTAIEAAKHSSEPHEIADEVVSRFMDNFSLKDNAPT